MAKSVLFRGSHISYTVKGKGKNIVFIHGFLGAKEIWKDLQSRLAKKFTVLCIDLPGHGSSEPIGYVHNMEMIAEAVHSVLQTEKIRRITLIGHSLGGYVSLAFAERYPDFVRGLMLVNSSSRGDNTQRVSSRNQLIKLVKENKQKAIDFLVPGFFTVQSRKRTYFIRSYKSWAQKSNEQGIVATIEGMKIRKEREIVLKFAPFTYLFVIGKNDPIFTVNQLKEEAQINELGEYEVLEDAGHMAPMESKEKLYAIILNFMKKGG